MKQIRNIVWILVPLLLAVFAVVERLRFLMISGKHLPVTGDEALAKLMAGAIAAGERPLLFWGTPYQFPLESYLLSPVIDLLPATALGARMVFAFLAALSVAGFLWLARLVFPAGSRWPVLLLVICPSTYVLTLQSAYFIPQHTLTMMFAFLLPLGVVMAVRSQKLSLVWTGVTGLVAGIALSTHFLSLPIVAATSMVLFVAGSFRKGIYRGLVFFPAFVIGLLPYLFTYKAAAQTATEVTGKHSLIEAVKRLFSPVLWDNLTPLLGFDVVFFPEPVRFHWGGFFPTLVTPLLCGFWLLLGYATFLSARRFLVKAFSERKLQLSVQDLFVGAVWASLLAFCFSTRGEAQQYRYLLPAAWAFPFLVGFVYTVSGTRVRAVLGCAVVCLAALNVAHTYKAIGIWQIPGHAAQKADLHGIKRVVRYMNKQKIDTCYATFWTAYRMTHKTKKHITCDQPFNGVTRVGKKPPQ
jgi:hypothetical protein